MALANCIATLKNSKEISPWLADDIDQALANRGRVSKKKALAEYIDAAMAQMKADLEDVYDDLGIDAKDPLLGYVEPEQDVTPGDTEPAEFSDTNPDIRYSTSRTPQDQAPANARWFRGVSSKEAQRILSGGAPSASDVPAPGDNEVARYLGLSDRDAKDLQDEIGDDPVINVTSDIENARGYGDVILWFSDVFQDLKPYGTVMISDLGEYGEDWGVIQNTADIRYSPARKIDKDIQSWAQKVHDGGRRSGNGDAVMILRAPTKALQLGGIFRPIGIDWNHAKHIFNTHPEITPEDIGAMPDMIGRPRVVIKRGEGDWRVILDWRADGNPLVAGLTNYKEGGLKVTGVDTMFGLDESAKYVLRAMLDGKVTYMHSGEVARVRGLIGDATQPSGDSQSGPQLPTQGSLPPTRPKSEREVSVRTENGLVKFMLPEDAPDKVLGVSFSTNRKLSDDLAAQQVFLTEAANDAGYDTIDEFAAGNLDEFLKAASQWRASHPEDVLYTPARSANTGQQIQNRWVSPVVDRLDNIRRVMQDKLVDTRKVVDEIRKTRGQVRDDFNPDLQETLYHSRTSEAVEDFLEDEVNPLLNEMGKRKITIAELETYLWASHAQERNAQIAKINPDMPDGGSGMTNQQAKDILAGQKVTINGADYQIERNKMLAYRDLGRRIQAITKGTTDLLVSEGLETQQTVDAWRNTYANYVPLMRDMESDDNYQGSFGLGTGQGFNTKGSASKRATGSDRTVEDILSNLLSQRERAITRAEKNKVSMAVYGLSLQNPNTDFWVTINPGGDQQDIIAKLVQMGVSQADAQAYADNIANQPATPTVDPKTGAVTYRSQPLLLQRDNVLAVRINGKDRYVMFSSDERAQQMVRNLKNLDDDQLKYGLGAVAKATRYFAAINTQYNPVFGLTNFARDSGTAMLNLSSTPLAGKQKEVAKHVMSALKGIYIDLRERRAGRHPTSQWAGEFDEFRRNGGVTGYRDLFKTSQDRTAALERELKNVGKSKWKQFNVNHPVMGLLSDYNTAIENAWRLAAYKVAKDSAMSKDQAAALAKNLTVNFNRKGQVTTQAGALYAFFNAATQGSARIAETLLTKDANGKIGLSKAGKKIAYGAMVAGAMQAVMFMLAGWDDKEPPQWLREKNFIIPTPWDKKKYVMFPMPLGFHVLLNMGRIPMEFFLGGMKNPGDRLWQMMSVVMDGFNPLGSSTVLQTLTPTVGDPIAALAENKDWSGKNIYREDFNQMKPTAGWTRTKDTATDISKALSYGINYITGGGKYGIGVFSPTPDQIDYVAGQFGGGLYREGAKLYQSGKTVVSGESLPEYKRPVVGRFYGNTTGQASEMSRFYESLKRIGEHATTIEAMKDEKDFDAIQKYRSENPEATKVKAADKFQRQLGYLKRQKRDAIEKGQDGRVKMLEAQISTLVTNANKILSAKGGYDDAGDLED